MDATAISSALIACATCMSDPGSAVAVASSAAILLMIGVRLFG